MPERSIRARLPAGGPAPHPPVARDADIVAAHLEDAAHFPGGFARGLVAPANEAEVAAVVRDATAVLPIGAQSSLTGGATPRGHLILSTSRLNRILAIGDDWVRVQAGVALAELDAALARAGKYYPPVPTFTGAFVGGVVATNAAGAATFKYGTTRSWVRSLTVVLPSGEVLDIERGRTLADDRGTLSIHTSTGEVIVTVPEYVPPQVPKVSAGYWSAPRMDLIDLFIGSEGTLGIVTEATLQILPSRPAIAIACVPFERVSSALKFAAYLREQ
jgi:D-lactate dehydrogenase (cytochrome)